MKINRDHGIKALTKPALLLCIIAGSFALASPQNNTTALPDSSKVIQFLNQTIDWYRTVGTQQQVSVERDLVAVGTDNRQMANQIVGLAFDFARAEADSILQTNNPNATPQEAADAQHDRALLQLQDKLDKQMQDSKTELESLRQKLQTAGGKKRQQLQSQIAEVQAELDLANARKESLRSMIEFAQTTGSNSRVGGLKAQIQALAESLPAEATTSSNSANIATQTKERPHPSTAATDTASPSGIWDLCADLFELTQEIHKVDTSIQQTVALASRSKELRAPLVNQLKSLAGRGDDLAQAADTANTAQLAQERQQLDSLATQFKHAAATALPLSKQGILLDLYQQSLKQWESTLRDRRDLELKGLFVRLMFLALVLGFVFGAAELGRRAVYRYVHEPRRRYQFLLLRKFILWFFIAIIVAFSFASKLGSVVTFAGLITAGVAVALQNVILATVGYFFLIGKYGVRLGDRVQIGGVTGEVIEIGLVRLHVMELSGGDFLPTGRIVAFSNSIVFQPTAGVFRQIPGTNFQWHEITLELSLDTDYSEVKRRLLAVVEKVLANYRDDLDRQYRLLQNNFFFVPIGEFHPKLQLRFLPSALQVVIRYPVDRHQASEIDERLSQELLHELDREPKLRPADSPAPNVTVKTDLAA
jgi:small-conductance mechanosensitive channel